MLDELKRALMLNDAELLDDVITTQPELSRYKIDPSRNVQIIHKACQSDNVNLVKVLVEKGGADLDVQDTNQWSPLMIACMNANYPVV